MREDELAQLKIGDLVRNRGNGDALVIVSTHPLVAMRATRISNAAEWDQVNYDGERISSDVGNAV